MGTRHEDQPAEHWAGAESLDPTPVWKQYILIALLLLKYLQLKATFGWSLSNLVALLRMNLFVYRDLWTWLHDPFTAPPPLPEPVQGTLALA